MFKVCLAFLFLAALAAAASHEEAWRSYLTQSSVDFPSEKEMRKRKANFFVAQDAIESHNNRSRRSYKMKHNKFSLMSDREKLAYLGDVTNMEAMQNLTRSSSPSALMAANNVTTLQTSVDWRADRCMQPVKDQAACGSCWAFAAVAQVEFGHCVKTGGAVALSEQQLVDCATNNYGCNGGSKADALLYIAKTGGIDTASAYPYVSGRTQIAGTCKYNPLLKGAVVSATSPGAYIPSGDSNKIMTVLAAKGLVTVSMNVVNSFMNYGSGVYDEPNCNVNVLGRHAVTIVGYGTSSNGIPYWVIRNSWSSAWGSAGYVLFKRGSNTCGIEELAVMANVVG